MSDFDALLKRSFAEAHEPQDDGFAVNVVHAVARSEKALQFRNVFQNVGMAVGGAVALYGAYAFLGPAAVDLLAPASASFQAVDLSPAVGDVAGEAAGQAQTVLQSLGAGLTQVLLIAGALAGGAVAYRAAQQD